MRNVAPLSLWDKALTAYLSSRHALGRKYIPEEHVLRNLRAFLARAGADLDEQLFDKWRRQSSHLSTSYRRRQERTVYKFCLYRRRSEPGAFLPDPLSFVRPRPHPLPTILGPDEIVHLLQVASTLRPGTRSPIRAAVMRIAVILLFTAGLRRGELIDLTLGDVDLSSDALQIRESKFHKARWVALSCSTARELRAYLEVRRRAGMSQHPSAPLICSWGSRPYTGTGFGRGLKRLCVLARVRGEDGRYPRVQDFRHSFAVSALERWYQTDEDVQTKLPMLALYMGHVSIASTAYYLRVMPKVVASAGQRFARCYADLVDGGAP
jgi:integrase